MEGKMKKYTIVVTETKKGVNVKRENKGFNIFELIGFLEDTKFSLMSQLVKMNKARIETDATAVNKDGKVEKIVP